MSFSQNILNWVRRQIIEEVPESDSVCEFDCRKTQCTKGEWDRCARRSQRTAGELAPLTADPLARHFQAGI